MGSVEPGGATPPKARLGLLGTINAPFLGYIVRKLTAYDLPVDSIILDSKLESEKDQALHEERTKARFPLLSLSEFEEQSIPCYFVRNHSSEATAALVRARQIDVLVNAGTPRILKRRLLDAPRLGVVNCHPGLLPEFRGSTCVEWAVYLDEQIGNTVHFMNERIDEGPIILRNALVFGSHDSYVDVRVKVYEEGIDLLAQGVRKVLTENLAPEHLEPQGEGRYFRVIEPEKMQEVKDRLRRGAYAYQRESL